MPGYTKRPWLATWAPLMVQRVMTRQGWLPCMPKAAASIAVGKAASIE